MRTTIGSKQEELDKKQRELILLQDKVRKGQVSGNGVPDLIQQLVEEIDKLRFDMKRIESKEDRIK